jgi:hypothetical protein
VTFLKTTTFTTLTHDTNTTPDLVLREPFFLFSRQLKSEKQFSIEFEDVEARALRSSSP